MDKSKPEKKWSIVSYKIILDNDQKREREREIERERDRERETFKRKGKAKRPTWHSKRQKWSRSGRNRTEETKADRGSKNRRVKLVGQKQKSGAT